MEQPIDQSLITIEGLGCDKRKKFLNITNFVKNQPLFDVHRRYLETFLTDLQAEVSGFTVEFSLFCLFSQNLARLSSGFIFYKLSSGDCLVFRVI